MLPDSNIEMLDHNHPETSNELFIKLSKDINVALKKYLPEHEKL